MLIIPSSWGFQLDSHVNCKHQAFFWRSYTWRASSIFLAPLPGRKITSARGVSHSQSFYFVIVFALFFLVYFARSILYQKPKKKYLLFIVVIFIAYFIFVQWLFLKIPSCVTLLAPTMMISYAHLLLHLLLKRPFMKLSLLIRCKCIYNF